MNTTERVQQRRAQVARLTGRGLSVKAIAQELGVTRRTIYYDRHVLGIDHVESELQAQRRHHVRRLTGQGWTAQAIAQHLTVTVRTVHRDRTALGIQQPAPRHLTDDEKARIHQLLNDGASLAEAARTVGCSTQAVTRWFRGRGWTPEQTGQHNALRALEKRLGL